MPGSTPTTTQLAAQLSVQLAGYQGTASILTVALTRLAELLQSSGPGWCVKLENDVTSNGQSAASLFASVAQGSRQICYIASGYLRSRVAELDVLDLPFSVNNRRVALIALDGKAGQLLARAVAQHSGYRVLGFWDNGFRHISNGVRPIRTPKDCEGLIVRTLDSAGYRAALTALGFVARTTDVKDLIRVVQSGEVHAQENPLTNLLNFGVWRYHPFLSLTAHHFGVLLLVCNQSWYAALTLHQQEALNAAALAATQLQRDLAANADTLALAQLDAHEMQILAAHELDIRAMKEATFAVSEAQRATLPAELLRAYLDN